MGYFLQDTGVINKTKNKIQIKMQWFSVQNANISSTNAHDFDSSYSRFIAKYLSHFILRPGTGLDLHHWSRSALNPFVSPRESHHCASPRVIINKKAIKKETGFFFLY
eukprot:GEMP01140835.1.p1 GENE.GEMP01140835.1~~GEMP01140835.1.p1  ORF type:complete len:108 (-),score=2.99 GEMP01140835.1:138-461(-)